MMPALHVTGLRDAASQTGRLFGTALSTAGLRSPARKDAILRECNLLTAEFELKWSHVEPRPAVRDYAAADQLCAFAREHDLAFHGHTLFWHGAIPDFAHALPAALFGNSALAFASTTLERFRGRVWSWDVVNEPLAPDHEQTHGLRRSAFLEAMGPGYIGEAFRLASAIDPAACLVLNEMGLEYASAEAQRKRELMLRLLERELGRGTPIHVLGLQSHLRAVDVPADHPAFCSFLREVTAMGIAVMITEMDVSDHGLAGSVEELDGAVAHAYRRYLEWVRTSSTLASVCVWSLDDASSWLQHGSTDVVRCAPLDGALRRKPAWQAIGDELALPGADLPTRTAG